jgi:hypothetical protein
VPLELAAPDRLYTKWKGECAQLHEPKRARLTSSRCQRISEIDPWRTYSGRISAIRNHSKLSMDLPNPSVPQGIRRTCPTRWPLYCKQTTITMLRTLCPANPN